MKLSIRRSRPFYVFAAALVIGIGLLWRSGLLPFPYFISKYGGDSLSALVVFLCVGFVYPLSSSLRIFPIAICFTWAIEFLQLYHDYWIDEIRSMLLGRLILGTTFNSPDLMAYALGIAIGALVEHFYFKQKTIQRPNHSLLFSSDLRRVMNPS